MIVCLSTSALTDLEAISYGSHLIFFRIEDEIVNVIRILHGAMDYDRLLCPGG